MEAFESYLTKIDHPEHRARTEEVLSWVAEKFPSLEPKLAWNQPMFTDHGTFIIGFSVSKQHMSVAPENIVIDRFADDIVKAGYDHTKGLFRIPWKNEVDFSLLEKLIAFNIEDKADCSTFWRK
ncbi:iron chaperone [Paenibacillus glycanilyticus]|uniref:Intracellular iron chaperone frataxin n=1 Tax=Paenibacillus glycanilyticus TaxID=126569 RepID=A0ABQ6GGU6_9BACL|nr:iron chaperone [Paenibacillus glycanilyticus]GLX68826.1 intracellular iron chaperone frataxin [Paenibacillus glycanilyticus]